MNSLPPTQPSLELGQDQFYAVRSTQGDRTVITIDIPLIDVPDYIVRPDPAVPSPGNRKVDLKHARDFATYLKSKADWVAPPLILRSDKPIEWESLTSEQGRITLGKARLKRKLGRLAILDGQHRVLGIDIWCDEVTNIDLTGLRLLLTEATTEGNVIEKARLERELENAAVWIDRLESESITATIVIEADEAKYKQAFADIADNVLGMQQTVRVMFDTRKLLNRAVGKAIELPLYRGRVDLQNDRVLGPNPNWLSAKSVVDVIRALHTDGITGRITAKREQDLTEQALLDSLVEFTEALTSGFPELGGLETGRITAQGLRSDSLLGSAVFIRVLASAFHALTKTHGWTARQAADFFALLAPHIKTPLRADSIWVRGAPECFQVGTSAPQTKNQLMRAEVALIVRWATDPDSRPEPLDRRDVIAA